jgi:hypothetical protein
MIPFSLQNAGTLPLLIVIVNGRNLHIDSWKEMVEKILQETATTRRLDVLIGSQSIAR